MSSVKDAIPNGNGPSISILEQPILTRRKLRLVCVGAGFSGLTLAHKIQHEFKLEEEIDLTIYEKNPEIGGTWYENTYPGAACDIPSHAYTFLFEPNPDWSKFYSPGPEIHSYIKRTAEKYNLTKHVRLNSKVLETIWGQEAGKWKIKVDIDGFIKEDDADILINGSGFLNKWKWPNIQGLQDFKGKLVHSANWDNSYNWDDKKIAVIGNGSSGLQIVSAMQPKVSKLVNYVRGPTWISINFCAAKAKDGKNFEYSEAEKKTFKEDPQALFLLRKELEASINSFFFGMYVDHPFQQGLEAACKQQMQSILQDHPEILSKMIPGFHPGCRRLSPCDGYLEALKQENASIVWTDIETITETGIRTADGLVEDFDMIVCATGFDTSFVPPWKLVGLNGATLTERWKINPDAFFSVQVDSMPNYFIFNGPNCPISHGSVLSQISWTCGYILRWVKKMATQDLKSVTPKPKSVADFNAYSQKFLLRTVWADKCRSWYKNGKETGIVTGTYAGSILHFKDALENIGSEHFDIVSRSDNVFGWLGNGQSLHDKDGYGDLAYYMEQPTI
ncbi:FAD/NAD(P)-binding domain-containing protein [Mollisia scopiformis]|uniref:FAD/NAD(P)-binding domain-containing protein n=1 Tax=Mollisia scopiformis TaxID=149040 RepID=A0A132B7E4_MOLSC|nr:FAD/NAD(P)-binding domain-containing protein [Mollisia scopiformis]KUJ07909.1 FAD/NAD(P)-binding domain-containing protein [Mollisia scopiformis]